jgi:hypothetical protein
MDFLLVRCRLQERAKAALYLPCKLGLADMLCFCIVAGEGIPTV